MRVSVTEISTPSSYTFGILCAIFFLACRKYSSTVVLLHPKCGNILEERSNMSEQRLVQQRMKRASVAQG